MQTAEEWVRENEPLAKAFVSRTWGVGPGRDGKLAKLGVTYDDLHAAALWGMWDGFNRWEDGKGASKATMAWWWMRARCQQIVRDNASQVWMRPKNVKYAGVEYRGQISVRLDASLDDDGRTLAETIADESALSGEDALIAIERRHRVARFRRLLAREEASALIQRDKMGTLWANDLVERGFRAIRERGTITGVNAEVEHYGKRRPVEVVGRGVTRQAMDQAISARVRRAMEAVRDG